MFTFPNLQKFPIGTRVRSVAPTRGSVEIEEGETGTVVNIEVLSGLIIYHVDWDKAGMGRHDCDGKARSFHGWNVTEDWLEYAL